MFLPSYYAKPYTSNCVAHLYFQKAFPSLSSWIGLQACNLILSYYLNVHFLFSTLVLTNDTN